MDELNNAGLKLFFEEEIYLIDDKSVDNKLQIKTALPQPVEVNEPEPTPLALNYKGGNAKGIAIVINDDSNEFLNSTDESLLLNILKAIGLSLDDVAIINQHNSTENWQEQIEFTKAIIFGILPSAYDIVSDNYHILLKNEVNWLFSDSLFSLGANRELKGKLWGKLQELFK